MKWTMLKTHLQVITRNKQLHEAHPLLFSILIYTVSTTLHWSLTPLFPQAGQILHKFVYFCLPSSIKSSSYFSVQLHFLPPSFSSWCPFLITYTKPSPNPYPVSSPSCYSQGASLAPTVHSKHADEWMDRCMKGRMAQQDKKSQTLIHTQHTHLPPSGHPTTLRLSPPSGQAETVDVLLVMAGQPYGGRRPN